MNKFTKVLLAATIFSAAAVAHAAELKIGYVDTARVLRESAPAQRAEKKLQKDFASREAEIKKMEKQGRDLQTWLEKEGLTAPEAERATKDREFTNLNRDYQRILREFREDVNLRRNEEFAGLQERFNKAVADIAQSEKFDLILQEALFYSKSVDVTDKVLKALADK
ncbi:MAG: OmpH family outer membrane protein [Burkholderiales bacterium]